MAGLPLSSMASVITKDPQLPSSVSVREVPSLGATPVSHGVSVTIHRCY